MTGVQNTVFGISCKRCKAKVGNGLKCSVCLNVFHVSCAKLLNIEISDDSTIKCCNNDIIIKTDDDVDNVTLCEALSELADTNNKVDIRIVKYLLDQKDLIIAGLSDKVAILTEHVALLNKCIEIKTFSKQPVIDVSLRDNISHRSNTKKDKKNSKRVFNK